MYSRSLFGQIKADLFRYLILFEFGGFYFDISKAVRRPLLSYFSSNDSEVITFERNPIPPDLISIRAKQLLHSDKLIAQWGFGFSPGHPILKLLLTQIEVDYESFDNQVYVSPKNEILALTGPLAFTRAVHRHCILNPNVSLNQVDYDFLNYGDIAVPGSEARHKLIPHYTNSAPSKLFIE
jgi:mannosyltransferase OCH1-like enzyme